MEENTIEIKNTVKNEVRHPVFTFFFAAVSAVILTGVIALAVFALAVRGAEEVLVPNVLGKELTTAMQEMQQKELYAKVQLRYSDSADEKGKVLEQNPAGGAIVKAGQRVTLVVSRGAVALVLPDYTGTLLDYARLSVKSMTWADGSALISIADPIYRTSNLPEGTIITQEPPSGTPITDETELSFVVSKGSNSGRATVPDLTGKSVSEVLSIMEKSRVIFDFSSHEALEGESAGTVAKMEKIGETVAEYTRIQVDFAFPAASSGEDGAEKTQFGIFSAEITNYPYAVPMTLSALTPDGETLLIASFMHKGASVSVPYAAPVGSRFTLSAPGKEITQ